MEPGRNVARRVSERPARQRARRQWRRRGGRELGLRADQAPRAGGPGRHDHGGSPFPRLQARTGRNFADASSACECCCV